MTILSFETSFSACSIALYRNGELLQHHRVIPRQHTQQILPMLDALFQESHCQLSTLDAIAFACGPGSFTGVRIAASVVQGLARVYDLPVIPVSSLRGLAQGLYRLHQHKDIAVAVNAHMGELFWAQFRVDNRGIMQLQSQEQLIKADSNINLNTQKWAVVGDAWPIIFEHNLALKTSSLEVYTDVLPEAQDIALIAANHYKKGQALCQAEEVAPIYLREASAWKYSS